MAFLLGNHYGRHPLWFVRPLTTKIRKQDILSLFSVFFLAEFFVVMVKYRAHCYLHGFLLRIVQNPFFLMSWKKYVRNHNHLTIIDPIYYQTTSTICFAIVRKLRRSAAEIGNSVHRSSMLCEFKKKNKCIHDPKQAIG